VTDFELEKFPFPEADIFTKRGIKFDFPLRQQNKGCNSP